MLDAIGVRDLAARVYSELVDADEPSVGDVAARCGVSTRMAATELTRLASLGLALRLVGRPVRYRAIAPDLALNALIGQREEELRQARAVMHQLTATFQERARHPGSQVEVVHGAANIARIAARVAEQTRHELRGLDRPPYSEAPGTKNALERRRIQDGVSYRIIYDRAALAVPGRMADILISCADGEQARARPKLPIKLLISDDQLALIPAAVTSHSIDTTFVIHRSPILTVLIAFFEAEWVRAVPIPAGPRMPTAPDAAPDAAKAALVAPPDEETSVLLGLLAAGLTDASIARSMSWSMRTAQRRVQQLMIDLGATTRFQAGMAARERGWV